MRPIGRHFKAPGKQLPIGLKHGLSFFGQTEHRPSDCRQPSTLLSQFYASSGATQQGDLVMLLQRLDVPGDGRLADEQTCRSASKTTLPGNCIERSELEKIHIYRPDLWLA